MFGLMNKIIIHISFLFFVANSFGQNTFQKTYFQFGELPFIKQTKDSGFIATGIIENGPGYGVVIKLDSTGDTTWIKSYSTLGNIWGMNIVETFDGNYLVTYIKNLGSMTDDTYIIKTNQSGDTIWSRSFSGSGMDFINMAYQNLDSGFILIGYTNSFGSGLHDIYLIRTNPIGDTLWTKTLGGTGYDTGGAIVQTSDSCFILVSTVDTSSCIIKLNSFGDTLWTKCYTGLSSQSMKQTADGGFAVFGEMNLSKFDSTGDLLWSKKYDVPYYINGSFDLTNDGGFILTGFGDNGSGLIDFNIRVDSLGDTLWCKTYNTGAYSVASTYDGGFIYAGYWVIKTDSYGHSFCNESSIQTIISSPVIQRLYPLINVTSTNTVVGHPVLQYSSGGIVTTECSSLNISSLSPDLHLQVFPNPVIHDLQINFNSHLIKDISIFNLLGEKIYSAPAVNREELTVNCEHFPPGIYFVRAETENGTATAIFIKE
jgi:hypothetical protein